MDLVRQCVRFREMLFAFTQRELRQRYVGTILGRPWPFLQPLILLGVYYIVFLNILGLRFPPELQAAIGERLEANGHDPSWANPFQVVLLCCGLLPWLMTAEFVVRSSNIIIENGSLVKKVSFPSELLPISLLASYVINLLVLVAVFCGIVWVVSPFRSPLIWLLPAVVVVHALFVLGLAYLLATINVFVRDVNQFVPVVVSLWFFLTPIVYVKDILVATAGYTGMTWFWIFDWNPAAYLVDLYRWVLIYPGFLRSSLRPVEAGQPLVWSHVELSEVLSHLGIVGAVSIVVCVLGYKVFMANKHKFADEI